MIYTGKYKHFKGNLYEVIGIARHSETMEDMVIYEPLYESISTLWVRPADMWEEVVEYNGERVKRFTKVDD